MQHIEMQVKYQDGTSEDIVATWADMKAFETWAMRRKLVPPPGTALAQVMPLTALGVYAWSAMQRQTGTKVEYDAWENTVAEIEVKADVDVDPTPPELPAT